MMSTENFVQYESNPSLQYDAIAIPYVQDKYVMTIFLPHRSQTLNNLTDYLHLTTLPSRSKPARESKVEYKLPKMKFHWNKSLQNALNAQSIFDKDDNIELTPVPVKISKMIHATEIEVDEEGTVSSAVNKIEIVPSSTYVSTEAPIQFYVDRPFLFNIMHEPTCTVLFTGKVHKPIQ